MMSEMSGTCVQLTLVPLTEEVMSGFADEARLLILNSIGSTAGTAVTGVATFSQLEHKPEITLGLSPFTYIYTWAGI